MMPQEQTDGRNNRQRAGSGSRVLRLRSAILVGKSGGHQTFAPDGGNAFRFDHACAGDAWAHHLRGIGTANSNAAEPARRRDVTRSPCRKRAGPPLRTTSMR